MTMKHESHNMLEPGNYDAKEIKFICQIDAIAASKDYLKSGICVRLFGIREDAFNANSNDQIVYTIDLDYWNPKVQKMISRNFEIDYKAIRKCDIGVLENYDFQDKAFEITVNITKKSKSYLYATFSDDKITAIEMIDSKAFSKHLELKQ